MNLVFIYGPPAVGKLSVARELATLTGFKLFDNHRTIDAVTAVFDFGTEPMWRLVGRWRADVIGEAARSKIDLIFTFVYAAGLDDAFVGELVEPVHSNGGHACFVQLTCPREELLRRVADESRHAYRKLTDRLQLQRLLEQHDLLEPMPFADSLRIDTTQVQPAAAAKMIVAHYALPGRGSGVKP